MRLPHVHTSQHEPETWMATMEGCHFTHGVGTTEVEAVKDLASRLWWYYDHDSDAGRSSRRKTLAQ